MPSKKICFRFDVDTHKCARVGIPNLVALARAKGVRFTFFLNCGRAISFLHSLKAALVPSHSSTEPAPAQLGPRRKLGNLEYLRCAILNPSVLQFGEDAVRAAHRSGHEIGLHGGRNHELWGRYVHTWSEQKIADEIHWGLHQLQALGISPTAFASPCAAGGTRVREVVSRFKNFKFIADDLNPDGDFEPQGPAPIEIPTRLCGRGGVAYIEQLVADGCSLEQISQHFEQHLRRHTRAVFYDHPYFAGDEALPVMGRLIDAALGLGFEVCTLSEMGTEYESHLSRQRA